jgi:hypothetical protein
LIIIDTREQKQDYIQTRLEDAGVECTITCLHSGMDYLITGTHGSVGIQRKDFSEVATQMVEIREDIIPSLMTITDTPVLLVEETMRIDEQGMCWRKQSNMLVPASISARQYYNFLQSIRQMGCEVVTTRDLDQSIWWMYSIHAYVHDQHYPHQKKRYGVDMQALGMLCCISGIGITRANKILKDVSIQDMVKMTDVQLSKLLTANQIVTFRKVVQSVSKPPVV